MKYEYDFETIEFTEDQRHLLELGLGKVDEVNVKIKEILNERAKNGWEPLYPFSVPQVWFRKQKVTRRKKLTKKS